MAGEILVGLKVSEVTASSLYTPHRYVIRL